MLKTTFNFYNHRMDEQLKKAIAGKYIEQIGQCILTDIAEDSKQAVIARDEAGETAGEDGQ